jgi:hypothetical protein
MSQENATIVRVWIEQFVRLRTLEGAAAVVSEFWDPDADYYPVRKFPDSRARHSLQEIAAFLASYVEAWDSYEATAIEVVAVDDVRVFVHVSVKAQAHDNLAPPVEGDLYHCAWLRNGRILRWEDHLSKAGALRGLGLDDLPRNVEGAAESRRA